MTSSVANPNGLREATADRNTVSLPELPFNSSRDNNKLTTNTHWLFCSFLSRYFVAKERKKEKLFPCQTHWCCQAGLYLGQCDSTIIFNRICRSEVTSRTAAY